MTCDNEFDSLNPSDISEEALYYNMLVMGVKGRDVECNMVVSSLPSRFTSREAIR